MHTHSSTQKCMKKRDGSERNFFYMLNTNAGSEMWMPILLGLPSLRCKPMSSESRTPGVIPPDRSHKRTPLNGFPGINIGRSSCTTNLFIMLIFPGDVKWTYPWNFYYIFIAVSSVHSGDGGQMFEPSANQAATKLCHVDSGAPSASLWWENWNLKFVLLPFDLGQTNSF